MLTNTYVSLREWFYPIGNTPAVDLLRDASFHHDQSEQTQTVELLLLACGDPRNILFSLFCHGGQSAPCAFKFTCCDYEPAVLGAHALAAIETTSEAFKQYWKTGVVGGNREDLLALGKGGTGRVNPMFAISSASNRDFALHYGSDPLLSFHLAPAFHEASTNVDKAVALAKSEFQKWSVSFSRFLEQTHIRLIMYCGEAVRLCYELQAHIGGIHAPPPLTRLYKSVWSSTPLQIDTTDSTRRIGLFDVIDTSNVVDHVGILNVLPAAPLLSRRPSSVLFTESLLAAADDPVSSLSNMLCSDIDTMILILGVAPIGYLTGVSTDSSATEIAFFTLSSGMARQRQFRTRITWKVPMLGDAKVVQAIDCDQAQRAQVGFDAIQFARYLFKVYLKMFEYEDWSKTLTNASLTSIHRQIASPLAADLRYYTRLSLVKLIYLAKTSVVTEWRVCMDKLVDMIENDRTLLIGSSSLQELSQHMHTFGIWEHSPIAVPPRQLYKAPHYLPAPTAADEGLLGQPDVPSVVFVALIVPRSKLKVFTGGTPESVGTPGLHLSISHGMTCQNSFHSIQCFFGKLRARADSIGVCDVEEDATGWNGSSDLVVTCQVPLYTLLLGPRRAVRVSLAVNTNPSTFQSTRKLGPTHAVFEAGFADKERVWLLKAAPGAATHSDQTCRFSRNLAMPGVVTQNIHVGLNAASQATTLRIQTEFAAGSSEANALEQGANVTISADSACTLLLTITGCPAVRLKFLLPIHGENTKTRISRKSCWIEVTVPIASALTDGGYKKHPFPVIRDQTSIISWGLPRVGLEELPIIPISDRMDWVHTFVSMALSEQERNLNKAVNQNRSSPALLELKESIHSIFLAAVGQHPRCGMVRAFQLIRDDTMSCDTIILVSSVRDDYDAGTIFLDAYVIPLTNYRIRLMDSSLQAFVDSSPLSVKVSAQEEVFWKKLLPAAAERCRTWNHRGTCEYATSRNIPLSTKHSENPLCACGEAEMSEHFPNATKYYLFRKHATRIAIPVLFAVPYVESVIPQEFKHPAGARTHVLRNTSQATTSSVTPVEEGTPACNNCGALKLDLKTCNRCRKVWYCNHACQKADWKEHKKVCGKK